MAVTSLRWLAAAAVWLPAASAGMGREHVAPGGPVQTPPPKLKDAGVHLTPRVLTARPAARNLLEKRDTNTCGYVDGNSRSNYVCANSEAQCLYNTEASAVGCCLTTDCLIYTACLPYASTDATRASGFDEERTRVCTDSDKPSCAVFSYADPSGSLSGYTIPTCDTAETVYTMYFTPTGGRSSSARETSTTSEDSESSTEPAAEASSSAPTDNDDDDDDGNQSPAETSDASSPDPETVGSSSTPVGPIVGGVVGGVAALGLLGLGIFFLMRRKNQNAATPPMSAANPGGPPGGPGFMGGPPGGPHGMPPYAGNQQQPPQQPTPPPDMAALAAAGAAYDPRYSMAKPPASPVHHQHSMHGGTPPLPHSQMQSPHMTVSPTASPVPSAYPPHMQGMGTPPPQQQPYGQPPQPYNNMGPTPPPPMQHQQNGGFIPYPGPPPPMQQHGAVELPTQKGDGQVHELS